MNIKRWTVCLLAEHKWNKIAYPDSEGQSYFLRCRRCGYENHNTSGGGADWVAPAGLG